MSCYFKNIEDKYNPLLSFNKPVIVKANIQIDKHDIKFNIGNIREIDFITRKIAKDISLKYNCLVFSNFNEINIVLNNPTIFKNKNNKLDTQNVVSLFSQELFMKYNELTFDRKKRFINVNAFNLLEERVQSYLFSRQSIGFNNCVSILGSKIFSYNQMKNKNREEIFDIIEDINPNLSVLKKYLKNGYTISNGMEIELYQIGALKNIQELDNTIKSESIINLFSDIEEDI